MLQFSNPAALWFLSLIIPIVLLYLLKRRRQDRIVPSTMLWKQVLDDTQALTPFQRLRSNLLLLLQILTVVLFTALLAQPFYAGVSKQSRKWVLVLDRSASMQAKDETPTRFEKAKDKLKDALRAIPSIDEVMLVGAGSDASILQNFTTSHEAIERNLAEIRSEDVAAEWKQVLLILKPLWKDSPKPSVIIASDFANFSSIDPVEFTALQVGKNSDNVGITKAALESSSPDSQNQILYFQLRNFSAGRKQVDVEVVSKDELLNAFAIQLDSLGTSEKTMPIDLPDGAPLRIEVKPEDDFPLDNDFVLISHPHRKISVDLQIENGFLRRVLQVLPSVVVSQEGVVRISDSLQTNPGIYFLTGKMTGTVPIVQWNQATPPLRFVDAGLWRISRYQLLNVPSRGDPMLESAEGVVAFSTVSGNHRRIVIGFRVEDSNLPLLAGFPIFMQNALSWIDEGLHPILPTVTNREHTLEGAIAEGKGYVNFADARESSLKPGKISGTAKAESQVVLMRQDFSDWFLIALLAVVMLEWWAFHHKG
jgi:hypothetical protein